jgi:hypothetical protein
MVSLKQPEMVTETGPLTQVDKKLMTAFSEMIAEQAKKVLDVAKYEDFYPVMEDESIMEAFQARLDADEFKGSVFIEEEVS